MRQNAQHESMRRLRFPDGFRYMHGKQEYVTYRERSTLRVWYSETPRSYESHYHSAVEIIMPTRGEVVYTLPGCTYRVQAGEVLIVPSNYIHELSMQAGSARYLLLFEPDAMLGMRDMTQVDDMLSMPLYLCAQSELTEEVRGLLEKVIACYEDEAPMWNTVCYGWLLQMYARLGRQHLQRMERLGEDGEDGVDSDVINSARLYIDHNCMTDISLDDMAAFSGFSKYYFSRVFKRQLGIPFSEYVRRRRVGLAEDLLIHSRKPIQEIAADAGFGSIATFNRVFREMKRCSPTRYREIYSDL